MFLRLGLWYDDVAMCVIKEFGDIKYDLLFDFDDYVIKL